MKKILISLVFILSFLSTNLLQAQFEKNSGYLLKSTGSVSFGDDVVIHNTPDRDQRKIAICSAFNGWLYAAYMFYYPPVTNPAGGLAILRSTDNGLTWSLMEEYNLSSYYNVVTSLDILACGDSVSNLKVFLAYAFHNDASGEGLARLLCHDADFSSILWGINIDPSGSVNYLKLCGDYVYPATNSNPYSIAVLYSKNQGADTLIFKSSGNGGVSFDTKRVVAVSHNHLKNVSINYGRCPSKNQGRYFIAWEETSSFYTDFGHIYTAHTEPDFNSPFTTPVCLDSLDNALINNCRNPKIACQYNNVNNDSANLTAVVLFEKQTTYNNWDIIGYYNKQAVGSSHFKRLTVTNSLNNEIQPDIEFNPSSDTFMATYFDSVNLKLPFVSNDYNLTAPDLWTMISSGYNDMTNITDPCPGIAYSNSEHQAAVVWNTEGDNGNGVALFDAQYLYNGISPDHDQSSFAATCKVYPNPCSSFVNCMFELSGAGNVSVIILSVAGQPLVSTEEQYFSAGRKMLSCNTSGLPAGVYLCSIRTDGYTTTRKLLIVK